MTLDAVKTALGIVEKSSKAIIGSVDAEGYPNIKAMLSPRERRGIKVLYFSTNTSSRRVSQFLANPKASVYFYDARFFRGVMFRGRMEVLHDSRYKELIWREGDTLYYKLGVTDPDYCVLRFTADNGRLYENFHSTDFEVD